MNENKESEWKNRERGALWKKQGKNQNYLTGIIKSLDDMGQEVKNKVIVFANKNKTSENAPDFIIYESKDMNQADSAAPASATASADESNEEIPSLLK